MTSESTLKLITNHDFHALKLTFRLDSFISMALATAEFDKLLNQISRSRKSEDSFLALSRAIDDEQSATTEAENIPKWYCNISTP